MIQRIQTVYLIAAAIISVVLMTAVMGRFVCPDSTIVEMTNLTITYAQGEVSHKTWALFAIQMLSAVVSIATIFLYKKRMLQIRLTVFNIILAVCYYGTLAAFVLMLKGDASFAPSWPVCLPFAAIVLNWLAIRAIGKDEMLVRAYDRLR